MLDLLHSHRSGFQNSKKLHVSYKNYSFQKLHVQYCALYGTFSKIVDLVCELRKGDNVTDLSDSISNLASRLFQVIMRRGYIIIRYYYTLLNIYDFLCHHRGCASNFYLKPAVQAQMNPDIASLSSSHSDKSLSSRDIFSLDTLPEQVAPPQSYDHVTQSCIIRAIA